MNDLITKVIEVSELTEKTFESGKQAKIKDQDNLTFTVWQKKKDGSTSSAWASLERVGLGSTIQIGYVEEEKSYDGKPYTARTIRTINEDIGQGMANAMAQGKTPRSEASVASETPKDDKFWDMKAYKQCLWNYWLALKQNGINVPVNWEQEVWNIFTDIEKDAKKRFFDFGASATKESEPLPELPTINVNEDRTCAVCGMVGVVANDGHDCIPFD